MSTATCKYTERPLRLTDIPLSIRREIKKAVDKGARRLDHRRVRWFFTVDPKLLDLSSGCNCVIGQLYEQYGEAYSAYTLSRILNNVTTGDIFRASGRHGFTQPRAASNWKKDSDGDTYDHRDSLIWFALDTYWKQEIRARRAADLKSRDAALAA